MSQLFLNCYNSTDQTAIIRCNQVGVQQIYFSCDYQTPQLQSMAITDGQSVIDVSSCTNQFYKWYCVYNENGKTTSTIQDDRSKWEYYSCESSKINYTYRYLIVGITIGLLCFLISFCFFMCILKCMSKFQKRRKMKAMRTMATKHVGSMNSRDDEEDEFVIQKPQKALPKKSLTEQFLNKYYSKLPVVDELNHDPVVSVYDDSEIV